MSATLKIAEQDETTRGVISPEELLEEMDRIAPDWTWGKVYQAELRVGHEVPARWARHEGRGLWASVHWTPISKVWCVTITDEIPGGLRGKGWQPDLGGAWAAALRGCG